jgi:hypothetical protein
MFYICFITQEHIVNKYLWHFRDFQFSEKKFDENSQLFRRPHAKFTIEKKIRRNASRYSDDSSSAPHLYIAELI